MAVSVPLRCQEDRILVVDADLLPHLDSLDGDDGDHLAKPGVVQPPPLCVWCERMVGLVSKCGTVLVQPRVHMSKVWDIA